ncbi:MAG: hypothetical protein A3A65_00670 [Candidatus Chisholmbacteria bacterium RIFCSPLOWO2_01_FULL_49_14]|nr:MAG: hypothetical protein A3A65_00670 [Candidatus Chisholmbacteria bacterium RIFCSPLOWO2_01_FULL_49_14]
MNQTSPSGGFFMPKSTEIKQALKTLGNQFIGLNDSCYLDAAAVVSANRDQIPEVSQTITARVDQQDGQQVEVVFDDPKLIQIDTRRGPVIVFDARAGNRTG